VTDLDPEKQIGQRITQLRTELGWSQQKLADQMKALGGRYANWRQGMIDKTEKGLRPLRVNEVVDLAAVLGVPPEFLFGPMVAGLDSAALKAKITETETALQAAERKYDIARGQLHRAMTDRSFAESEERETAGRAMMLRAMLEALQREQKGLEG
jgi:transcriptional regulator with XRE-family HTH domain